MTARQYWDRHQRYSGRKKPMTPQEVQAMKLRQRGVRPPTGPYFRDTEDEK